MEIYLVNARNLLHVLFNNAEFSEKPFEGAQVRCEFGDPLGLTFTFEKTGKGFFLYINFSRFKDPAVLTQITNGQTVGELQLLLRVADLPRAKIFGSKVLLPDGRSVELIDTVGFELRKVWEGAWESENNETEVNRRLRQMRLNKLRDKLPGVFEERPWGLLSSAGKELLFSDALTAVGPGIESGGELRADTESTTKRGIKPEKRKDVAPPRLPDLERQLAATIERALKLMEHICYPPGEDGTRVDNFTPPEKRDPSDLAECDECEKLFYESELTEINPGTFLCDACYDPEMKVKTEFRRPTAEDVNKAIQLLLWRCRDAQIHKGTPDGKRGFYGLEDWIANAEDQMIRELGLWCEDIQELNIGTRDS